MSTYKEIVTKAVIGKGKKTYRKKYVIDTDNTPNTVLGCWVINHKFTGKEDNNKILIEGSYDINVWYSYDNDTKTAVLSKTINYTEEENVNQKHKSDSKKDVIIRSLKQPNCINAKEKDNTITLEIEKELGIELIGDTKVKVAIEEDEEPWDILGEEKKEEDIDKEIDKIDENFINEKNTI